MPSRLMPLYVQIAEDLRQQILSGSLAPESRLPTQRELADRFNTTLMTVRQALEVLTEENLIRTEHGIGSFVISPQVEENEYNLLSFSSEMSRRAVPIETRLISLSNRQTSQEACRALLQPADSALVRLERLRLLHGKPIVYQCSYLPQSFAASVQHYSPEVPLYQHLHQLAGLVITNTKEVLKACVLNKAQANLFHTQPGTAALLSLRVSFQQDGTPTVYDEAVLAADSFVIETERFGLRNHYQFHVLDGQSPDPFTLLVENE